MHPNAKISMKINTIYSNNKFLFFVGLILSVLPIIIYFLFVFYYAINIPFFDEYFFSLGWLNNFNKLDFPNNIMLLFIQANEHRIFTYLFSVMSQYLIFGELNYRHVIIIGNLGMFGLMYILYLLNTDFKNNPLLFIPVILLLFVPIHEITDWAMLTISGINQYLLVFASLAFLNRHGYLNFSIALILAGIVIFSFGSGMFISIAGLFILIFQDRKSLLKISTWISFMAIFIILFFLDYNFHAGTGLQSKLEIINQPFQGIIFFLTFFGSIIIPFVGENYFLLPFAGLIIIIFLIYLLWKNRRLINQNSLAYSYLLFILLSIILATISRFGYGIYGSSTPRYALRSTLFIIVIYIITVGQRKKIKSTYIYLILIMSFILYGARVYYNNTKLSLHKTTLIEDISSYYEDPSTSSLSAPDTKIGAELLTNAIEKGYYVPPTISELYPEISLLRNYKTNDNTHNIIMHIDYLNENHVLLKISGWAFLKETNRKSLKIGIVLLSNANKFVFSTKVVLREDVVKHFSIENIRVQNFCGFNFVLDKNFFKIKPGKYKVGICIYQNKQIQSIKYSNRYVEF